VNALATEVVDAVLQRHPDWGRFMWPREDDDVEFAVPAPAGSAAGHLVVFTDKGLQAWVRFEPPAMCYPIDNVKELLWVLEQIETDAVAFVATWAGAEWTGTTLVDPRRDLPVNAGETAQIVCWSGTYDRVLPRA